MTSVGSSLLAVLLMLTLMLGQVHAVLFVWLNVVLIVLEVCSSLKWWGIDVNSVSMVHLFMSTGLAVD